MKARESVALVSQLYPATYTSPAASATAAMGTSTPLPPQSFCHGTARVGEHFTTAQSCCLARLYEGPTTTALLWLSTTRSAAQSAFAAGPSPCGDQPPAP
jgi:hypothetical protein